MRRAWAALLLLVALAAGGCAPTHQFADIEGAAVLTAATIVGALLVASFVARTSGRLPQGRVYQVALTSALWLGPAALLIGAMWVLWAFEHRPTERGETTWGLFIAVLGLVITVMVLGGSVALLTGS